MSPSSSRSNISNTADLHLPFCFFQLGVPRNSSHQADLKFPQSSSSEQLSSQARRTHPRTTVRLFDALFVSLAFSLGHADHLRPYFLSQQELGSRETSPPLYLRPHHRTTTRLLMIRKLVCFPPLISFESTRVDLLPLLLSYSFSSSQETKTFQESGSFNSCHRRSAISIEHTDGRRYVLPLPLVLTRRALTMFSFLRLADMGFVPATVLKIPRAVPASQSSKVVDRKGKGREGESRRSSSLTLPSLLPSL